MKYYNIKNRDHHLSFREAVTQGISSDMGLFMPATIPSPDRDFFLKLAQMDFRDIAFEISRIYIEDEIPAPVLRKICDEAFNFPLILKQLDEKKYVLELFHGPTAAFKDFGARFMSQCFKYFASLDMNKTVVLVATSGDTGGAIANSFLGVEGVDVIILYPSGKVSEIQEKQLTTLGNNITALEVAGTFDDCQLMVKEAFTRFDAKERVRLTSANSINIARLIPQSFYYYYAISRILNPKAVISVPSGNFGNITGSMLAWRTGLPVERFIVSTNVNSVVPEYLESGLYRPRKSVQTIANAMDVGNPSNFDRLLELFENDINEVRSMVSGYWFTDGQIREHIKTEFARTGYVLDPHGAVASLGLDCYLSENQGLAGVFVETAHPAKFCDIVEPVIGRSLNVPESLQGSGRAMKQSIMIKPGYPFLEGYLKERYM